MPLSYVRVNWQDSPSTTTPVDSADLNVMDAGVDAATTQINTNTTAIAGKVDGTHGFYNGFKLFVGPTTPTGMAKGDVWIKTPFS